MRFRKKYKEKKSDFQPNFFHNFSKKSHVQSEHGVLVITQMNIFRDLVSPPGTITDRNHTGVSEKTSYLP
jgi:ribosomal protein S18